jgi:hypothetical protein
MPPEPFEFRGPEAITGFFRELPFWGGDIKVVPVRANNQPAFVYYVPDPSAPVWRAGSLMVLALDGNRVCGLTRFASHGLLARFGLPVRCPGTDRRAGPGAARSAPTAGWTIGVPLLPAPSVAFSLPGRGSHSSLNRAAHDVEQTSATREPPNSSHTTQGTITSEQRPECLHRGQGFELAEVVPDLALAVGLLVVPAGPSSG